MNDHLVYFKAQVDHKRRVYKYGRKIRVSHWRLILHDWQKFSYVEWNGYVKTHKLREELRDSGAGYDPNNVSDEFSYAWLHHKTHGKHHWQYWILPLDGGGIKALDIPDVYKLEMMADWMAVSSLKGKVSVNEFYAASKDKMVLHPDTRVWIEEFLAKK